jgi:hypothetical protein
LENILTETRTPLINQYQSLSFLSFSVDFSLLILLPTFYSFFFVATIESDDEKKLLFGDSFLLCAKRTFFIFLHEFSRVSIKISKKEIKTCELIKREKSELNCLRKCSGNAHPTLCEMAAIDDVKIVA